MNSTEIIIWIIVIFIITFFSIHIGLYGKFWKKAKEIKEDKSLDANSRYLLSLALALIVIGFVAPFIFTGKSSTLDFIGSGEIGDTMGGLMSPFINVAAVIVTGLAFYAQYEANASVRKQFEIQKFEAQFYERLRLHKENVNEMEIEIDKKNVKGRTAFYKILEELENILIEKNNSFRNRNSFERNIYSKFYDKYGKYISHYFRHLFHTVKFVVNQKEEVITKERKKEYLQILRAQMSNDEQKLLFYNWLAPSYGGAWENKTNKFFTKHKMLHNLWYNKLNKHKLIRIQLKCLVIEYLGEKGDSTLFEIGDDINNNFGNP